MALDDRDSGLPWADPWGEAEKKDATEWAAEFAGPAPLMRGVSGPIGVHGGRNSRFPGCRSLLLMSRWLIIHAPIHLHGFLPCPLARPSGGLSSMASAKAWRLLQFMLAASYLHQPHLLCAGRPMEAIDDEIFRSDQCPVTNAVQYRLATHICTAPLVISGPLCHLYDIRR